MFSPTKIGSSLRLYRTGLFSSFRFKTHLATEKLQQRCLLHRQIYINRSVILPRLFSARFVSLERLITVKPGLTNKGSQRTNLCLEPSSLSYRSFLTAIRIFSARLAGPTRCMTVKPGLKEEGLRLLVFLQHFPGFTSLLPQIVIFYCS